MIAVCVEIGTRKTFASALDWPGWSRSGRDEAGALECLADYGLRYQQVVAYVGHPVPEIEVPAGVSPAVFEVVERIEGNATTDFGAPGMPARAESEPLDAGQAYLRVLLMRACWDALDDAVEQAPELLRKGPRGGGRDRDAVYEHVHDAEVAYMRKLGLRDSAITADVELTREAIATLLARPSDGSPLAAGGWTPRYALRRIAWHALDHAWEIEDRSEPA